jgi:hypothetical protein
VANLGNVGVRDERILNRIARARRALLEGLTIKSVCAPGADSASSAVPEGTMNKKKTYTLDGIEFSSLEEFANHFSNVVLPDWRWNGNLEKKGSA